MTGNVGIPQLASQNILCICFSVLLLSLVLSFGFELGFQFACVLLIVAGLFNSSVFHFIYFFNLFRRTINHFSRLDFTPTPE